MYYNLLAPLSGNEATLQRHRELPHLKCTMCTRYFTERRREEHIVKYHRHACNMCSKRFTKASNLTRHKNKVDRRYQCPFCPVSMIDTFHDGPAVLHRHVTENHHGKTVHHCDGCNSVFSSEANYKRHIAILHNKQCTYCGDNGVDTVDGGDRYNRLPKFATVQKLRQHVATTHNQNVCNFVVICLQLVRGCTDIRWTIVSMAIHAHRVVVYLTL